MARLRAFRRYLLWGRRLEYLMRKLCCTLAVFFLLSSWAHAQSTVPHPRLILDANTLAAVRSRAAANTPQWQQLKQYCDSFIGGTVNTPLPDDSSNDYPDAPDIGQGYEGDGYWAPLWSEALCYQTVRLSDPVSAAKYGAKAADMAVKMSLPTNMQGEDPCKDDGYVMRFFRRRHGRFVRLGL